MKDLGVAKWDHKQNLDMMHIGLVFDHITQLSIQSVISRVPLFIICFYPFSHWVYTCNAHEIVFVCKPFIQIRPFYSLKQIWKETLFTEQTWLNCPICYSPMFLLERILLMNTILSSGNSALFSQGFVYFLEFTTVNNFPSWLSHLFIRTQHKVQPK